MAETAKKKTTTTKAGGAAPQRASRRKRVPDADADTDKLVTTASGEVASAGPEGGSRVPVVDAENKTVREVNLHPAVFAVPVNHHLLYEAVKQYRAGARRGTHMTKNRALVSGSGRKPWRQKGTGRARVGEIRNPLWRHGGTVFGPQPRDYSYSMPKKARASALRSALSQRVQEGALKVVESFPVEIPQERPFRLAKQLQGILGKLGVVGRTVLVDSRPPEALVLSGRNMPDLKVIDESHLTVYDVLDCKNLLVSQEALSRLEERLVP
jgi:large subunit ribosomal protein L4